MSIRPNILYLHSHDTGRYIQPYGQPVATPNLQKLAEQGVLFRQAFNANPTCSPSRACLLTGQCAHSNGMLGLAHRGFALDDYSHHLVHTLHQAGYTSALAGIQHIAHGADAWQRIGYHHYLGGHQNAHDTATAFLDNAPDQPFFLSVGFAETHREFPTEIEDSPEFCMPPTPLPDTPETRLDMARFKASARILDQKMGQVLEALERNGLAQNTLVICTTDHGIAFPRMKCTLTDSGIGVMLLLRGPGGFSGPRTINSLVSQIDIFPTICDLLDLAPPPWLEGKSFLPLIRGEVSEINEAIFAEVNYHAAYEPQRCVRTKRWKYIRRFAQRSSPVLPNCDDSLSKSAWMEAGWGAIPPEAEALFDLVLDPNECNNLVASEAHAGTLDLMRQKLQAWMTRTQDPLLDGPVPAPAEARVNDPDGVSPRDTPQPVHMYPPRYSR